MQKIILTMLCLLSPLTAVAEVIETQETPDEVTLAIYPEGKALVHEKRSADLVQGANKILVRNIPRDVAEGSILLRALTPHGVQFIEYSFQSDQITRKSLLEGSIGLEVQLISSTVNYESVRLLAIDGDEVVVKTPRGILAVDSHNIAFHRIPYRLTQHPLMTIKLLSDVSKNLVYEVSYLANGLSWDSSYTIIVTNDATRIDMNSWIHIHNASGIQFTKAKVRIAEGQREEDTVVYKIPRMITLPDLSSKNVEWFTAHDVPTLKSYRIYSTAKIQENEDGVNSRPPAEIWLSVKNHENHGLGQSLPAGNIKVFQRSADGRIGYMGENRTSAITHGEQFSLRLGKSTDLSAEMKQTDFRRLSNQVVESGYNVLFTNNTDRPLDMKFVQNFDGEWTILRESVEHQTINKDSAEWTLTLPAKKTQTLRFRVRMKMA